MAPDCLNRPRGGQISPRTPIEGPLLQRLLLEEEGVVFDAEGRVDLSIYRWQR